MQKKYITTIMILLFAIAALICYAQYSQNRQPVLTIGVCADSYWDVPAGESTALMEKAIKLFQSEHPHVQVRLITSRKAITTNGWQKSCWPVTSLTCISSWQMISAPMPPSGHCGT